MNNMRVQEYLTVLKSEISPALGCTEPAAVALAVAYAAKEAGSAIKMITVNVSKYIFKNGMNVGIPGTGIIGLDIAVALGAISAAPEKKLMVLTGLSNEEKETAKQMVADKKVKIGLISSEEKVHIQAIVQTENDTIEAVISGSHTNLVLLRKNDNIVFEKILQKNADNSENEKAYNITLADIVDFVDTVQFKDIEFLQEVLNLNQAISKEGLTNDYGLQVGKSLMENNSLGLFSIDVGNYAIACTAAAADARMSGCDKPVMSAAGSGNQGLTASIPVAAIGYKLGKPTEKIIRSLAISILVTIHTKHYIGRLSVLCGCSIAASIGTCCGIIFLLDGNIDNMKFGINSMVADISGVVCDGAKPGCALKIATAVSAAIRAATMALQGLGANSKDGIVTIDVEKTLANLGTLGNEGMSETNSTILEMMLDK